MKQLFEKGAKLLAVAFNLLLINHLCHSQNRAKDEINIGEFIQSIFPIQNENLNYEEFYETFYQLYQNPINLNTANREELASLYVLSEIQINSLLAYRAQLGKLLSIYELQAIPTFDLESIRKILPFVVVNLGFRVGQASENYLVLRTSQVLESQKGFQTRNYLGSALHTYTRFRYANPKDFGISFTTEKDAGEKDYLDFFSGNIIAQNKGKWKNILIGDYQVQIGQGLISSAGYFVGKGGETINTVRRSHLGIRPYSSIIEMGFFRGVAATYLEKNIEFTGFYSSTQRDASLNETDLEREEFVSSLLTSGYHRTPSEIDRKNNVGVQDVGLDITLQFSNGQVGFSGLLSNFDVFLQKKNLPYNYYEFSGKQNHVFGSHATYNWRNFNFFGEIARSKSGGMGLVSGFLAALSKQVEFSMLFRNYDKNFHSFYANSFGENTRTINEQGIYWGIKYLPKKGLTFSAFYDQFRFPWLKFLVNAPSSGYDYLFKITYQPNKKHLAYFQFHEEHKGKNLSNGTASVILSTTIRRNYVLNFDFTPNRAFKSQTRLALNTFAYENQSVSHGYALIQDVEGRIKKWQLKARLAYFNTQDYDSRVYAFENDVLYAVSFPAYYGTGFRSYLVVSTSISPRLGAWLRISRTQLQNQSTYGSGNEQIAVPHKSELKLQLRWKF